MNLTIYRNAQYLGPYTDLQVGEMLRSGDLSPFDLARTPGMLEWKKLSSFVSRPQGKSPVPHGGAEKALAWLLAGYIGVAAVPVILVALAVPNLAGITQTAGSAKAERIARNLASLASAARAVGYAGAWHSKAVAFQELTAGISITVGGRKMEFKLEGITPADLEGASKFIELRGDNLIYIPAASSS